MTDPAAVPDVVTINGHQVDARYADLFYNGATGELVSDEDWDEQVRRIREHDPDFTIPKVVG